MDTRAGQPSGPTAGLREFLAEPARDEAWSLPPGTGSLLECQFQVEEQLLGEHDSQLVPQGGLKLNRVTYRPLSPEDVPAIAGYRAGLEDVRLVLAMFWFMLTELPAKRRYDTVRISVRLQPPAPVLLLSPDGPASAGQAWPALAAEIAAAIASLLPAGSGLAATGVDLGDDGFGWKYEARDDAPLIPQRITTLVILELPPAAAGLVGVLDADAQISRSVLGKVFPKKATLVNPAVPFHVPFTEGRSERRAGPDAGDGQLPPPASTARGRGQARRRRRATT